MPYSLVLNLLPLSPIQPGYLQGRHFHALFLNLVSSVDRKLGDRLHDEPQNKPFTLSPLQFNRRHNSQTLIWEHKQTIPAGTPCWWRVSLLDDSLFRELTQLWLNLNPEHPWHLGSADLRITSILGTPQSTQPWANACTYQELHQTASDRASTFTFTFATPTAFRQGKYDTALPTKDVLFNSLLKRWNKYSNIEITSLPLDALFPSFFNLRTQIVADSRSKFIGCVGEISYRLMGQVDPTEIKNLNALADFALYCGVGRKTPMGMGMTRRIKVES